MKKINKITIKDIKNFLENFEENSKVEYFALHTKDKYISTWDNEDGFDCKVGGIEETTSLKPGNRLYDAFHEARNILNENNSHEFWNDFYINVYGDFNIGKVRDNGLMAKIMVENGTCDIERILYKKYNYRDDFLNLR